MVLSWQLDPFLIGTLLTSALCYFLAVGPLRKKFADNFAFPTRKAITFLCALIVLYLAEGSLLHDLSNYLLSAHMLQHLLISYVAAPLVITGMPKWLLKPLLINKYIKPTVSFLVRPLVAGFVFSFFFSIWHLPFFYEGALDNAALHHIEHIVFLSVSLIVWWPIMSPLKELPALHYGGQILYLFVLPIVQTIVFAFITFAPEPLYAPYMNAPIRVWNISVLADQAWAGVIMKVGSMVAFGAPFVAAFLKWESTERK